jgi:hypothetical protein
MKEIGDAAWKAAIAAASGVDIEISVGYWDAAIEVVAQACSPQWVSVKEKLPEPNAKVVVRTNNGRVFVAWITAAGNWYSLDQSSEHGAKETHWMGLPAAP